MLCSKTITLDGVCDLMSSLTQWIHVGSGCGHDGDLHQFDNHGDCDHEDHSHGSNYCSCDQVIYL